MVVMFGLLRIIGDDKPLSACTLTNEDLFDMQITDDFKPTSLVTTARW